MPSVNAVVGLAEPAREERPPSGCHVCGLAERGHYQRYAGEWHKYIPPTQAQIKTRMQSRRRYLKGRA